MFRILVLFGTTEGHTAKVARFMATQLRAQGHSVEIVDTSTEDPDPAPFDAVLVAASVHAGAYQSGVVNWVLKNAVALNAKPSAFVSVCLGVLQHESRVDRDLHTIIEAFLRTTAWRPVETKIVAGALKYSRYNFLKRWLMLYIARKAGGDTDASRDYEYTDWADLQQFTARFCSRLESPPRRIPA